jgi:hypothetical protein
MRTGPERLLDTLMDVAGPPSFLDREGVIYDLLGYAWMLVSAPVWVPALMVWEFFYDDWPVRPQKMDVPPRERDSMGSGLGNGM